MWIAVKISLANWGHAIGYPFVKFQTFSYRYALEILQHSNFGKAWQEISGVLTSAPTFVYPGKSSKNKNLDVVQQLLNAYFDRRLALDLGWDFHPLATGIKKSALRADFRKTFSGKDSITVQAEVQFGNMARWYSDIFKFQAAYSSNLIQLGLSIVPMQTFAKRIDSNVANFERTVRELPSAILSVTLPILLIGVTPDDKQIDVSRCAFPSHSDIVGKKKLSNRWRIVHGYISGVNMEKIGPDSPTGPTLADADDDDDELDSDS